MFFKAYICKIVFLGTVLVATTGHGNNKKFEVLG